MMNDTQTTIQELKKKIEQFMTEREWKQFHAPKNMSMLIVSEATELMELFLWVESKDSAARLEEKRQEVEHEIADIAIASLCFCVENNIDLSQAIEAKMKLNAQKYPVEKAKGNSKKYNEY